MVWTLIFECKLLWCGPLFLNVTFVVYQWYVCILMFTEHDSKQPKSIKIQRVDPLISQKLTLFWTVFPRVLFKKVEFLLKYPFTLGKQVEVVFLRKNESDLNWSDFLLNTLGETTCITHFLDCFFH